MSSQFTIHYCLSPSQKKRIPRYCCVKLIVVWFDTHSRKNEFCYCLHCGGIFCRSGFYYHKEKFIITPDSVQEQVSDFFINQETHKELIKRQFETRFFIGRMRGRVIVEGNKRDVFVPVRQQTTARREQARRVMNDSPRNEGLFEVDHDSFGPDHLREEPNQPDRFDDYPELFDCFSNDWFVPEF